MYNLPKNAPIGTIKHFQQTTYLKTSLGWAQFDMTDSEDRKDFEERKRELKPDSVNSAFVLSFS